MASVKVLLYTSKTYKNGEHPVMIRIIKKGENAKYIFLEQTCKADQWDFKNNEPNIKFPNYRKARLLFSKKKNKINEIILDYELEGLDYTLSDVIQKYKAKPKKATVYQYLDEDIERLMKLDKIGTANTRKDLKRALSKFLNGEDINFPQIDHKFLKNFEDDFISRGVKETSISVYMRTLKAIYNRAIEDGYCKKEHYPFDKYKTSKLNTKTEKRALTKKQLDKIINCKKPIDKQIDYKKPETIKLKNAHNYFLFSYYNRGMNLIDIAKLKWDNIEENRLKYVRSKNGKRFNIELLDQALEILEYYKQNNSNKTDYIFPILTERQKTMKSIKDRVNKVNGEINDNLRKIGALAKIPGNITFYVARHSWASIMYRAGIPIPVISEALGHDDEKTTRIYLAELGNKVLDEANKQVLSNSSAINSVLNQELQ